MNKCELRSHQSWRTPFLALLLLTKPNLPFSNDGSGRFPGFLTYILQEKL